MVAVCLGVFVVWHLKFSDLSSLYRAWAAARPGHIEEGGWVSYQQQICVRFRGLVWDEKSTSGKLLSEALLLSEVLFSWRVIVSSGTRNCFVRSLRRRVESSLAGKRKKQVLIEN